MNTETLSASASAMATSLPRVMSAAQSGTSRLRLSDIAHEIENDIDVADSVAAMQEQGGISLADLQAKYGL